MPPRAGEKKGQDTAMNSPPTVPPTDPFITQRRPTLQDPDFHTYLQTGIHHHTLTPSPCACGCGRLTTAHYTILSIDGRSFTYTPCATAACANAIKERRKQWRRSAQS